MLKAAFNYQVVQKDRGGYVHHPTCLLQLLYDSLESLSERVDLDMSALRRPCTLQNGPHGSHRGFGTTRISLAPTSAAFCRWSEGLRNTGVSALLLRGYA